METSECQTLSDPGYGNTLFLMSTGLLYRFAASCRFVNLICKFDI
jgi:hypothetical protein